MKCCPICICGFKTPCAICNKAAPKYNQASTMLLSRRYHCPHLASGIYGKPEKSILISEYTDKYPAHQYRPVGSYKPTDVYEKSSTEIECLSTFRADYVPHMVVPRKPRVCSKYEPNKEYMDMDTIYKQDYCPHLVRPPVAYRPLQCKQTCKDKMDLITTYQGDYQLWNFSKRESRRPANTYHPPKESFDMKSTFQDHFRFWPIRPTQSYKPVHLYTGSLPPVNYITNYKLEYVPYQIEKIRVHKKENYRPNEEPFDCLTTNMRDYKGLPGNAAKLIKPRYCLMDSDMPFSGMTEVQDKYQIWPIPPSLIKKTVTYKKPTDKMDFMSTTQYDFTPHVLQRQAPCKPGKKLRECSKAFEASSTMREDFKPWQCKKASPVLPQLNLDLPVGSFENTTTTRHDYVLYPLSQAMSFRTVDKTFHKDLPGYVYLGMDSLGHMQNKLQSKKENKSDFTHTTAVPLSAECFPPEKNFVSPSKM
ncbi:stabilizer of axonemal microtubules 1 isoform X2 [Hyla sarda]|uniref:stabilizer of axonemal microtubules 1 isoform X2 n=1 Tax=Hyla sarda TaxID=327740 RepID=UPI0024C45EDF|nr:stabilizer of axonemal microtubules 1 isoform X2 [Hyla sarda]